MPARHRSKPSRLPKFATGFKPAFNKGWVDRLKMSFTGGWVAEIDGERLERHLRQVSELTSPFLKPTRNRNSGVLTVKLATGWLFGGQLTLHPSRQEPREWNAKLALNLNVTRFVQTHGVVNWSRLGARKGWDVLRTGTENSVNAERESLTGVDNLISKRNLPDAISADWSDVTEEYVKLVLRCMDRCINQATDVNSNGDKIVDCTTWGQWSIGQAEIYWEATGEDAVSAVTAMGDNARAIADGLDYREYDDSDIVVRTDRNSPSLNLKIENRIGAAVYAKTFERIRYEVRYGDKVRSKISIPPGQASGSDLSNLCDYMDHLIDDARKRLLQLLPELHAKGKVGFNERSALVRALMAVSFACGKDHLMAYRLITLLSNTGGVSVKRGDTLFEAVDYLQKTKTLRRVRIKKKESVHRYRLSEPLRSAFRRLSENRQR